MLKIIAAFFGFQSTLPVIAALIAILSLAGGLASTAHVLNRRAERKAEVAAAIKTERGLWEAKRDIERARQAQANRDAVAAAQERIAALTADKARLEQLLKENGDAAAKDSGAHRPALSPDGVLRLNRVR